MIFADQHQACEPPMSTARTTLRRKWDPFLALRFAKAIEAHAFRYSSMRDRRMRWRLAQLHAFGIYDTRRYQPRRLCRVEVAGDIDKALQQRRQIAIAHRHHQATLGVDDLDRGA